MASSTLAPKELLAEGVSIIATGLMGGAYTARVAGLGIPVTIWNRTASKAAKLGESIPSVKVASSLVECANASKTVLVACSPTHAAIGSISEQLAGAVRDKHVTFIVDSGLSQARMMEEVLFEKGKAASLTSGAMFGTAMAAAAGEGAVIHASGKAASDSAIAERVLPLLNLFGATTYRPGGTATAAYFAMAGHLAFMPVLYSLMHYTAIMAKSGVDSKVALDYFQATNRAMVEGFAPLLSGSFEKHDYSMFLGSHQTVKDIEDCVVETCKAVGVDDRFARLMSAYHEEALKNPELAAKSFHSVHEVISRGAPTSK